MMSPLQQFLYERKLELFEKEKKATGIARLAMTMQIQMIDSIFQFLSSQQTEDDMAKLRLTLDKQATPVDDIQPRQENAELTESIIELAKELDNQFKAQKAKDKKAIKYPLNALPSDIKPKSVSSKIYGLRQAGKLPLAILPKTRTVKDEETGEEKEVLYMVRVTDDVAARYEKREKEKERNGNGRGA